MKDQVESLCANGVAAGALNSSNDETENAALRRSCMEGKLKLLYISPEKLIAEANYLLRDMHISLFAIDEAHCISHWGHDFRPEYTQLSVLKENFPKVPIIALTANAFADDEERSLAAGMDAHISKPLDAEKLIQVISDICKKRKEHAKGDADI